MMNTNYSNNQDLEYKVIIHDVMDTILDKKKEVNGVISYILNNKNLTEKISDKLNGIDVKETIEKGEQAASEGKKNSKEFKAYLNVYNIGAPEAYKEGLQSNIYNDAKEGLEKLSNLGYEQTIFGSGSKETSKLSMISTGVDKYLESYLSSQDLGSKTDPNTYKEVAQELGVEPKEAVYINDLEKEAEAAAKAGLRSFLIDRKEKYEKGFNEKGFVVVKNYKEIINELDNKNNNYNTTTTTTTIES